MDRQKKWPNLEQRKHEETSFEIGDWKDSEKWWGWIVTQP